MQYLHKTYRHLIPGQDLAAYQITVRETDLYIRTDVELKRAALQSVHNHRASLEAYIAARPAFLKALTPLEGDDQAPEIVRDMLAAARLAGVGPMAAVAGAVAQHVAQDLLGLTPNVIVENGGDIYLKCNREVKIGIFAGASPLSRRLALRIRPEQLPAGVCTSSGTVGPSLSYGIADAVCVMSTSAALADAAATAIGNLVRSKGDVRNALKSGAEIPGVRAVLIIIGEELGAWGELELV